MRPEKPARRSPFRVPFVRKCHIAFSDDKNREVFIANINEYGAYLADAEMPQPGQGMSLRFRLPDSETEVEASGAVAWVNPLQQHPVHSLPPGYGLQFDPIKDPLLSFVLGVVAEYLKRHSDQGDGGRGPPPRQRRKAVASHRARRDLLPPLEALRPSA